MTEREIFFSQFNDWHTKPYELYESTEDKLRQTCVSNPNWHEWEQKAYGYQVISEEMGIKIFPACPFAFEFASQAFRGDIMYNGLPAWFKRLPAGEALSNKWNHDIRPFYNAGIAVIYGPVDDIHHTLDYETILRKGLVGILEDIKEREKVVDKEQKVLLKGMKSGLVALMRFAQRFHEEALKLSDECHGEDQRRMLSIASAIKNAPTNPAKTFHEALNAIVFMYYALPSLECSNISVFGHLDRLLHPYLQNDLQNQILTEEEAYDLIWRFLAIQDARYGYPEHGTNATVMLGGCDAEGIPVYNQISRMVLKAVSEYSLVDPKINIRISKDTDPTFLQEIAETQAKRVNNIAIFNDDVIIPANVMVGKALADSRVYVGGGCQENIISHCEINNRATIYMNNCAPLLAGFFPNDYNYILEREGQEVIPYEGCDTFAKFYHTVVENTKRFNLALIELKNRYDKNPLPWCASPLHSALLGDCIDKAQDMYLGGARYSYNSVSQGGIATLINSLMAVKTLVYDNQELTLGEMADILKNNFAGHEVLRHRIINRLPKFGQDEQNISEFSGKVFSDMAKLTTGIPNPRNGMYEASLFSFRSNVTLGKLTGATPDGRKRGEYLSQGMSPSIFTTSNIPQVFGALQEVDLTAYPVVAVLDFKLPATKSDILVVIYQQFVACGGSVLQLNIVDQNELEKALVSPEKYPDLVVRMCGYSAHFIDLTPEEQQEVVARVVYE